MVNGIFLEISSAWNLTHFWNSEPSLNVGVGIGAYDVITHGSSVLRLIREAGSLREYYHLPLHMTTILHTVMKDTSLDTLDLMRYLALVKDLKPDLFTTIEVPLYDGEEDCIVQLKEKFYRYHLFLLSVYADISKVVVIVPGRNKEEITKNVQFAHSLGFIKFGLACAYSLQKNRSVFKSQTHSDISIIRQFADEIFLIGVSSPRYILEYPQADYIVTKGWYHKPVKFKRQLTPLGSRKFLMPPRQNVSQTLLNSENNLRKVNLSNEKTYRENLFKVKFSENIAILLNKLKSTKEQSFLEEFTLCLAREVVVTN